MDGKCWLCCCFFNFFITEVDELVPWCFRFGPGRVDPGFGPGRDEPGLGPGLDEPGLGPGLRVDPGFGPGRDDPGFGPGRDEPGFGPGRLYVDAVKSLGSF